MERIAHVIRKGCEKKRVNCYVACIKGGHVSKNDL